MSLAAGYSESCALRWLIFIYHHCPLKGNSEPVSKHPVSPSFESRRYILPIDDCNPRPFTSLPTHHPQNVHRRVQRTPTRNTSSTRGNQRQYHRRRPWCRRRNRNFSRNATSRRRPAIFKTKSVTGLCVQYRGEYKWIGEGCGGDSFLISTQPVS